MRSFSRTALQVATTIHATETVIDSAIDVRNYDKMIIWLDYAKGDETGVYVIPKFLEVVSGDEHKFMEWSNAEHAEKTERDFYLTATGKAYITLDIEAIAQVKIYEDANAGTPTGTLQVGYTLLRKR